MNVRGSVSIEKNPGRWSKSLSESYLAVVAIGILSGIVVAYARTPIHWPGHKAVFWIAPVLGARLVTRTGAGASIGALATAITTFLLGGRIGGGIVLMPLIILAGIVLDLGVQWSERIHPSVWRRILLLALAGLIANLICFLKRLADPIGPFMSARNLDDLLFAGSSHAMFGCLAGLIGAAAGYIWLGARRALGGRF
jgi:hypothetical protein